MCGGCIYFAAQSGCNVMVLKRVFMGLRPCMCSQLRCSSIDRRGHGAGCQPHIAPTRGQGERGQPAGAAPDAASVASGNGAGCQGARQGCGWCVRAEKGS